MCWWVDGGWFEVMEQTVADMEWLTQTERSPDNRGYWWALASEGDHDGSVITEQARAAFVRGVLASLARVGTPPPWADDHQDPDAMERAIRAFRAELNDLRRRHPEALSYRGPGGG
jgi:hypothetical protein